MLCRFKTGAVKGSFWENQERPHKKPCLRGKECSDCAETRLPRINKSSTLQAEWAGGHFKLSYVHNG